MRRSEFHPEAALDIEEIWEYIAKDSLDAADRVVAEIESTINKAAVLPEIGHARPDLASGPMRFVRIYDYLIAYFIDEAKLFVIAVLHGRRNPRILAALLSDRQH